MVAGHNIKLSGNECMRILHILDHSIPLHSGYVFRTLSILHEQNKLGWKTFHITSSKHPWPGIDEESIDGIHFYRTRTKFSILDKIPIINQICVVTSLIKKLKKILPEIKPDILHAHSPCLNGLAALYIRKKFSIPVVYEMRASWEDAAVSHGTAKEGNLRYRISRAIETYTQKKADHITTICDGLKKDIMSRSISDHKITVIPNAVDVKEFNQPKPDAGQLKTDLGLNGKIIIGYIGSFYHYEGLDIFIDALKYLLDKNSNFIALLVGGGFEEEELKQKVTKLGLENRVVFIGRVPHECVSQYYSLIDILVYARRSIRLTEIVTPLKPLEAMANKKPIVASDVGGHTELISDGVTGKLFKSEDPISLGNSVLDIVNKGEDYNEVLDNAYKYVAEERNWQRSVSNYKPVYSSLSS
jgi:PEP-CTERM/exosortase A-associated glycosyltransferase